MQSTVTEALVRRRRLEKKNKGRDLIQVAAKLTRFLEISKDQVIDLIRIDSGREGFGRHFCEPYQGGTKLEKAVEEGGARSQSSKSRRTEHVKV